jgi:hypothetical protein
MRKRGKGQEAIPLRFASGTLRGGKVGVIWMGVLWVIEFVNYFD